MLDELGAHKGATTLALRRKLAAKAYARTAAYNSAIANWFAAQQGETFPERLTLAAERVQMLRYGENPHQQAAFYADGSKRPGVATARQVQGKELSYNNINDTDAAYECVAEFSEPAVVVIKHANPCGVAVGRGPVQPPTSRPMRAIRCRSMAASSRSIARSRRRPRPTSPSASSR